jgi:uncharacterized phiE125 gp8 family phage protein
MATNWTLTRVTSPSNLPVSLSEVKDHLRLSSADTTHDNHLQLLIEAATERLEDDIDRQIISANYKQSQLVWNEEDNLEGSIKLYKRAITDIVSVQYYDEDNVLQTLDASKYEYDAGRTRIWLAAGEQWPTLSTDKTGNKVEIVFTAGYGTADTTVPRSMKAAILLCVGKWFFDPAQEGSALHSQEVAYERLVMTLMRSTYP